MRRREPGREVVITGLGAITALGVGVEAFWSGLLDGRSGFGPITLFDPAPYRARRAAEVALLPPDSREETSERAHLLLFSAAAEALAGAEDLLRGERSTIVLGSTLAGNRLFTQWLAGDRRADPAELVASQLGAPARELGRRYGSRGEVTTLSVACASGAAAVGEAVSRIRRGDAEVALAGGFDALSEFVFSGFDALRALSVSEVRPFDRRRDGLGLGEGAGCLLVEELTHAERRGARPLAFVRGYASAGDAHHMTRPSPGGDGLVRAIRGALDRAAISASAIGFVSSHGTATTFNDRMEAAAFGTVFGEGVASIPVHSVKSAIGHSLGAAGALEALLTTLVLDRGRIPPTVGYEEADPECPLDVVAGPGRIPDPIPRFALSTSSAFAGTNAAIVLERP